MTPEYKAWVDRAMELIGEMLATGWTRDANAALKLSQTLRTHLENPPKGEPVAWRYGALLYHDKADVLEFMRTSNDGYQLEDLFTTPPDHIAALKAARKALEKLLRQFTKTPSSYLDSCARCEGHAAIAAIDALEKPHD